MTVNALEYLKSFRLAESRIQLKTRQVKDLQDRLLCISAPMDKEVVSHTPNVAAMTCEACEAETQARLIARGKRSATPGIHHPTILRPQRQAIDESLTKSIVTQQKG